MRNDMRGIVQSYTRVSQFVPRGRATSTYILATRIGAAQKSYKRKLSRVAGMIGRERCGKRNRAMVAATTLTDYGHE